jgi:hypothetical protein
MRVIEFCSDALAMRGHEGAEPRGPPIVTSVQSGYGSGLIRNLVPHELGGSVELTFPRDGACCKIEIPSSADTTQARRSSPRNRGQFPGTMSKTGSRKRQRATQQKGQAAAVPVLPPGLHSHFIVLASTQPLPNFS